jgi:hypothetical protein
LDRRAAPTNVAIPGVPGSVASGARNGEDLIDDGRIKASRRALTVTTNTRTLTNQVDLSAAARLHALNLRIHQRDRVPYSPPFSGSFGLFRAVSWRASLRRLSLQLQKVAAFSRRLQHPPGSCSIPPGTTLYFLYPSPS